MGLEIRGSAKGKIVTASWQKFRRFIIHKVLHADDTPHRIALGVALGLFVGMTPTLGLQMVIALAVATLFRANKIVCVPMVWITNPVTAVPVYAVCYRLGNGLLGTSRAAEDIATEPAAGPIKQILTHGIGRVLESGFWHDMLMGLYHVGTELWVGCLFAGFIIGTISYFVTRWTVVHYRDRRRMMLEARAARRQARRFARHAGAQRTVA